jgi:hypothetical protein
MDQLRRRRLTIDYSDNSTHRWSGKAARYENDRHRAFIGAAADTVHSGGRSLSDVTSQLPIARARL